MVFGGVGLGRTCNYGSLPMRGGGKGREGKEGKGKGRSMCEFPQALWNGLYFFIFLFFFKKNVEGVAAHDSYHCC
jgi:hypothetical protein